MLNLAQLRADTPGVEHRLHLNNAGASLMPRSVLEVMQEYLKRESEIGGYETADERQDVIEASYNEIAALIGTKPDNAAVVANATAGFVQGMSSFDFVAGDTIITSRCDYTSFPKLPCCLTRARVSARELLSTVAGGSHRRDLTVVKSAGQNASVLTRELRTTDGKMS